MKDFDPSPSDANQQALNTQNSGLPQEVADDDASDLAIETPKPRNNAMMVLAMLVVLGVGAVMFMRMKAGPKPAAASPEAATAKATINQFLTDGSKNITAMRELLKNTEKVVQQFLNYPSMTQVKLEDLKTNPFRFAAVKLDDPNADAEAKRQAAAKRLIAEKEAFTKIVQQIKLQSILHAGAGTSTCMINNATYTEGQELNSLKIQKITPNSVVFTKGSLQAEVKINR